MRFPYSSESRGAIRSLTKRLALNPFWSDDWATEVAERHRLKEFCRLYSTESLSDPEKFALMSVIVASLDDYLLHTFCPKKRAEAIALVEELLRRDFRLHAFTVLRWADPNYHGGIDENKAVSEEDEFSLLENGGSSPGMSFMVSPMMRRIWATCAPTLVS